MAVMVHDSMVTEDEATVLMIHHLKLACAYFEATHNDRGRKANKEITKRMDSNWANASSAFVDVLCSEYEGIENG